MQMMSNTWLEASGEPALTHPIDTDMVSKANSHDNAVRRSNRRYEFFSSVSTRVSSSIISSKPAASTSRFISAGVTIFSSYSTIAVRPGNDTDTLFIPSMALSLRSTLALHPAHAIPNTGSIFFSMDAKLRLLLYLRLQIYGERL